MICAEAVQLSASRTSSIALQSFVAGTSVAKGLAHDIKNISDTSAAQSQRKTLKLISFTNAARDARQTRTTTDPRREDEVTEGPNAKGCGLATSRQTKS